MNNKRAQRIIYFEGLFFRVSLLVFMQLSFFFGLLLTTEAMGIWRFAGAFAVVKRQSECGSKTAGMHVSQPMNIGVC